VHRQIVFRECLDQRLDRLATDGASEDSIGCVNRCGPRVRKDTSEANDKLQNGRRAKSTAFGAVRMVYDGLITSKERRKLLASGDCDPNVPCQLDKASSKFFESLKAALGSIDFTEAALGSVDWTWKDSKSSEQEKFPSKLSSSSSAPSEIEILFQVLLFVGSRKMSPGVQDMVNVALMYLKVPLPLYIAWCKHHDLQPTSRVEEAVEQERMAKMVRKHLEAAKEKARADRLSQRKKRWSTVEEWFGRRQSVVSNNSDAKPESVSGDSDEGGEQFTSRQQSVFTKHAGEFDDIKPAQRARVMIDVDGDGVVDYIIEGDDADGDGIPDELQVDDDGDGIPDALQDGCIPDASMFRMHSMSDDTMIHNNVAI